MMSSVPDQQQRELALTPNQSFIVQAPAGSGKTSLLIQRYLTLLAYCDQPEEILAITFTRKAAYEMHIRIFAALTDAFNNAPPADIHKLKIWQLARTVIERDQQLHWNLLNNPQRLRLQTIDSLCSSLVKQMPVLSGLGTQLNILEEAALQHCQLQAARNLLQSLEDKEIEYLPALIDLLHYLDNDFQKAEKLLASMLQSRDQWLPHIVANTNEKLKITLEQSLANITAEYLTKCKYSISDELQTELIALAKFTNLNLQENEIELWKAAANLLLTKDYNWRKTVNKNQGFTTADKKMKQSMEDLLSQVNSNEILRENLQAFLLSPPVKYSDEQWQMIANLLILLKHLAANLQLVFQEQNSVDYTEVALAALRALGEDDNPTDLALKLDYKIKHILIDEFQDTSVVQYHLLEKLTVGWQEQDGRTLFVVGDPMQSIYKFREAKVGLFIRAKTQGINAIKLHPITLTANFRSENYLVNWVNATFPRVMPPEDSIGSGAIKFIPAIALQNDSKKSSQINLHAFSEKNYAGEAQRIVEIIKNCQTENPADTIAILVRSRSHLTAITLALRNAKIAYQAVELENLQTSTVIQDLFALTRALLNPADRIAWLTILRAPWCGLNLTDLHAVGISDQRVPLWSCLNNYETITDLSDDGKLRIANLLALITPAIAERRRKPLAQWVEEVWLALNGPSCVASDLDLSNAKLYFELLNQYDIGSNLENLELLRERLSGLFAEYDQQTSHKLQIMTMHRAKGLEFDTVIIPGLERSAARDESKLLNWLERPSSQANSGSDLIFAPIKRTFKDEDQIYNYLRYENQKKDFYETGRLLYVAVTRAKKNLHLLTCLPKVIAKNSLLEQIKFCFNDKVVEDSANAVFEENKTPRTMRRIASEFFTTKKIPDFSLRKNDRSPVKLENGNFNSAAKNIGIVIHQTLAKLSTIEPDAWPKDFVNWRNTWRLNLLELGTYENLAQHIATIEQALDTTLNDQRGRWILDKNHQAAQSEYALTTLVNNEVKQFRIDRTFVDNGQRWIIDYKTEMPNEEEVTKHLYQLQQYAKLFNEPVHLGLYFPRVAKWIEIKHEK
jgi:ATP-dependent helicase/nuclease subunit A